MVWPSAAVTITTSVFSPVTRLESPTTSKVESWSTVRTSTTTSSVPQMYVTESPSRTVVPSMVTSALVSVLNKTLTVTMYS